MGPSPKLDPLGMITEAKRICDNIVSRSHHPGHWTLMNTMSSWQTQVNLSIAHLLLCIHTVRSLATAPGRTVHNILPHLTQLLRTPTQRPTRCRAINLKMATRLSSRTRSPLQCHLGLLLWHLRHPTPCIHLVIQHPVIINILRRRAVITLQLLQVRYLRLLQA